MKKYYLAMLMAGMFSMNAMAAQVVPVKVTRDGPAPAQSQIVKREMVQEAGRIVFLATYTKGDRVCREYVASTTESILKDARSVEVKLGAYCASPAVKEGEPYPRGLREVKWFELPNKDIGIEMLTIDEQ
ncbi:uncharacterized protein NMK_2489 [Novimethylophilus kurashikiensis]|uniref:Uncharacterized protein n=1 Tax=Novimethylophilus kurashikiensis TaxID=1825523 RepID=A0A2R5FBH2_9PROT|nr:hypothetical protein [Novimethylophilus kurashikiensis]GBG14888.1 uncharacterized protein NMK_2489 [Novimethylophilus kurashikiensis]